MEKDTSTLLSGLAALALSGCPTTSPEVVVSEPVTQEAGTHYAERLSSGVRAETTDRIMLGNDMRTTAELDTEELTAFEACYSDYVIALKLRMYQLGSQMDEHPDQFRTLLGQSEGQRMDPHFDQCISTVFGTKVSNCHNSVVNFMPGISCDAK